VMTANVFKDVRWLKAFVWLFLGLGALYLLGRVIHAPAITEVYTTGYTANSMFWTWMVALSLSQVLFNPDLSRPRRLVLFLVAAVTLYLGIIEAYDWKSGWVPPLVVVGVLLALRYKKLALASIPFALAALVFFIQRQIAGEDWSWGTRVDAWRIVLEVSSVNPVLGLGFGNYYWYVTLFNIRGYYVQFNSHSQYVDLIAQTGIAGLICFVWILIELGRLSWSLSGKLKDGFARGYAYGILAGLAGVVMAAFLVDWILPFAYNIGLNGFRSSILPWIFFGGLISIQQIYVAEAGSQRRGVQWKS
jgi:O-Antigen ligase